MLFLGAIPALAAENWVEAYNRGVSQVRASNFQAGAQSLQRAIDEMPEENAAAHVRDQIFTYTPHFWLGIARLNSGDPDGALREWKISEDQGAIKNTPYFAQLRALIARANSDKQRRAEGAAAPSKQEASSAIGRTLSAQMDAVIAGGDRSETYHAAQRKLADARETSARAGTDVRTYKRAVDLAEEARGLFSAAAAEAKKQRAARPVKPPPPPTEKPAPREIVVPFEDEPQPQPQPARPKVQPQQQPPAPVPVPTATVAPVLQPPAEVKKPEPAAQPEAESEALVAARVAVQQYRRRLMTLNLPVEDAQALERELKPQSSDVTIRHVLDQLAKKEQELDARKPVEVVAAPPDTGRQQLEAAYRMFAAGDLPAANRALTQLITATKSAEAYLLRGCVRYTQAMLSRHPDPLVASAGEDMQAAYRLNHALALERGAWSPKLVAFFEQVKQR